MGVNPQVHKNHAAINTLIMTIKKRICYMERLKSHDPNTIKSLIESRIRVEKYAEKMSGKITSKWDAIQEFEPPSRVHRAPD
jgi:hypothetical protein